MLKENHYQKVASLLKNNASADEISKIVNDIRLDLNPHPAGQLEKNVPQIDGVKLTGIQHKYKETMLFFPKNGQTCHAYCTFCFRWPQFTNLDVYKFAMRESELMIQYLRLHPEITDILFTGGDPMVMRTKNIANYIDAIIDADLPHVQNIRIGTKSLAYWPYRFTKDKDADDLLRLLEKANKSGKQVALMAHFNHPNELDTAEVEKAIARIRATGTQIRTQSPLLRHINDDPKVWQAMWNKQVKLGCIPYYMFMVRDTGAQHYFSIPLYEAWNIFRQAYRSVSGIARTVRGPSMSASPGKVQILGVSAINGEKVFVLRFLQGRNPEWVHLPFFAKFDKKASWLDDLKPAFGQENFFYEKKYPKVDHTLKEMIYTKEFYN